MKSISLSLLFMLCCFALKAQTPPSIGWQKSLGGSLYDAAYAITQTADSGFLVACTVESTNGDVTVNHGSYDCWLVKLSTTGGIVWKKTLGGSQNDFATDIQRTKDGGYIMAGYTKSSDTDVSFNHGGYDAWVVKLSSTGVKQWEKTYGGSNNDVILSIRQTTDTGYIVAGWSSSSDGDLTINHGDEDAWVVKLTATGGITWQKSLGGTDEDHFTCIEQTTDGGYIVSGAVRSTDGDVVGNHGGEDIWLVKLTSTGGVTWKSCFGGTDFELNGDHSYKGSVHQTTDGGYILSGSSQSSDGDATVNHGDYDMWIVKVTAAGTLSWQKSLGGTGDDGAYSVLQTPDGGYIAGGLCDSSNGDVTGNHGLLDVWVVKLSSSGSLQWQRAFGSTGSDIAFDLQKTIEGNYVVAGYASSNSGDVTGVHGGYDAWIVKLLVPDGVEDITSESGIIAMPNPTSGEITVSGIQHPMLEVVNALGQLVIKASDINTISLRDLPNGIYALSVYDRAGVLVKTEKIVKR
jgi:hypothetical protein